MEEKSKKINQQIGFGFGDISKIGSGKLKDIKEFHSHKKETDETPSEQSEG